MKNIRWIAAVGGAVLGEICTIAAAFLWVAIYAYLLDPGRPDTYYEAYAQVASPWVALIAGFAIFYAVSRWIARSVPTAMALFAFYVVIDVSLTLAALLASLGPVSGFLIAIAAASYLTKLLACFLGARHSAARPAQAPA